MNLIDEEVTEKDLKTYIRIVFPCAIRLYFDWKVSEEAFMNFLTFFDRITTTMAKHPPETPFAGAPPFKSLDDYYVRSLGPRLDTLLAKGYISEHMHRQFRQYVEDAKARVGGSVAAPATVATPHPVRGNP